MSTFNISLSLPFFSRIIVGSSMIVSNRVDVHVLLNGVGSRLGG